MRPRPVVAALIVASTLVVLSPPARAASGAIVEPGDLMDPGAPTLAVPPPSWYTPELHQAILASGPRGFDVPLPDPREQATELNCLGYSPPYLWTDGADVNAVSAGGCMVFPAGCTMNFIFTDGTSHYIGTAGHCVSGNGSVVMQVATRIDPTDTVLVTLAAVGKVAKRVNQGIGRDFALVKINPGLRVVPGVAGALGPTGIMCLDPVGQPVVHYGHGYVFAVEQGDPKAGEVIVDLHPTIKFTSTQFGYNWAGYGLPGDSGSPVMDAAGLAVGNLSHGIGVLGVPLPGLNFGTTVTGMFDVAGPGFSLVTLAHRPVNCSGPVGF